MHDKTVFKLGKNTHVGFEGKRRTTATTVHILSSGLLVSTHSTVQPLAYIRLLLWDFQWLQEPNLLYIQELHWQSQSLHINPFLHVIGGFIFLKFFLYLETFTSASFGKSFGKWKSYRIHLILLVLNIFIFEHLISIYRINNLPQETHFISYKISHLHCAMCQRMLILYQFYF